MEKAKIKRGVVKGKVTKKEMKSNQPKSVNIGGHVHQAGKRKRRLQLRPGGRHKRGPAYKRRLKQVRVRKSVRDQGGNKKEFSGSEPGEGKKVGKEVEA